MKTSCKLRTLLPLAVLVGAVAVLAAGTAYLHLGRVSDALVLNDLSGDAAALRGFTLHGSLSDYRYTDHFSLQNCVLTHDYQLETNWGSAASQPSELGYSSINWCIAPEERTAAEGRAQLEYSSDGEQYTTTASQFVKTCTLSLGDTSLRFVSDHVTLAAPTEVYGYHYNTAVLPDGSHCQDYSLYSFSTALFPDPGFDPLTNDADYACLQSGNTYFAMTQTNKGGVPGIYRVDRALSNEELRTLPVNAAMGNTRCLASATPYGSYSLFYALPEDANVKGLTIDADGGFFLLYILDGTGQVAHLDADGNVLSLRTIGENLTSLGFLARPELDVCSLYGQFEGGTSLVAAFTTKDGHITDWQQHLAGNAEQLEGIVTATLNRQRTALLIAKENHRNFRQDEIYTTLLSTGTELFVYRQDTGKLRYHGALDGGQLQDWRGLGSRFPHRRDLQLDLATSIHEVNYIWQND